MKINSKEKNNLLIIGSIILIIVSLILITYKYKMKSKIEQEQITIKSVIVDENDEVNNKSEINKLIEKFSNNEIVGILYVSDIITIPIVQTDNNDYYLKYALNNTKQPGGAVFMDYRTFINDKQLNIYGHNSTRYDLPFKNLEKYLEKTFALKNNYIKFKTNDKTYKYKIFSAYIDSKNIKDEHYKYNFNTNEEWLKHFNRFKANSLYDFGETITEEDNMIVLQTCLFGENRNKLLIIVAKQIN